MAVALRDLVLAEKSSQAELDFTGVDFASRAFIDELLKVQQFLAKKQIILCFKNVAPSVASMLELVAGRVDLSKDKNYAGKEKE